MISSSTIAHKRVKCNDGYARIYLSDINLVFNPIQDPIETKNSIKTPTLITVALYGIIKGLSVKTGRCSASNEYLGDLLGIKKLAIVRNLNYLKSQKLIQCQYSKPTNSNGDLVTHRDILCLYAQKRNSMESIKYFNLYYELRKNLTPLQWFTVSMVKTFSMKQGDSFNRSKSWIAGALHQKSDSINGAIKKLRREGLIQPYNKHINGYQIKQC